MRRGRSEHGICQVTPTSTGHAGGGYRSGASPGRGRIALSSTSSSSDSPPLLSGWGLSRLDVANKDEGGERGSSKIPTLTVTTIVGDDKAVSKSLSLKSLAASLPHITSTHEPRAAEGGEGGGEWGVDGGGVILDGASSTSCKPAEG
ncbi:unnamed protein product, partial [Discosporangium mesarthrocarpum]